MAVPYVSTVLLLFLFLEVFAEPLDITEMSMEELESLAPEQLNGLPAKELFAKLLEQSSMSNASKFYDVLVRTALHRRMYGFDQSVSLDRLIQDFQADNGFPITGTLTFAEFQELSEGSTLNQVTPVYPGGHAKPYIYEDRASVEGTWVIDTEDVGEQHAFPVNTSRIECFRSWGVCIEFTVQLNTHDFEKGVRSLSDTYYMNTSVDYWDVLDWSENEVVMKQEGECRTVTITLNAKSGEVYEISRNAGGSCEVLGTEVPKLEAPRVAVMKPGFDVTNAYFQEMKNAAQQGLSSRFLSQYDDLAESFEQAESETPE